MADGNHTETDYDNRCALELNRIVSDGSYYWDLCSGNLILES